jgi:hypothetical protein
MISCLIQAPEGKKLIERYKNIMQWWQTLSQRKTVAQICLPY